MIKVATIKKCDVCGKTSTPNNPTRKMTIFFGKDVINGIDKFYQQEVDICLDCRNELRDKTARMEYEFVQDKQYSAINPNEYNVQVTYEEVENPTGSPVEQSWYELVDGEYTLSEDTEVDTEKTYYKYVETYTDNPKDLDWYEKVNIDYVLSLDEQVDLSKTYYEKKG